MEDNNTRQSLDAKTECVDEHLWDLKCPYYKHNPDHHKRKACKDASYPDIESIMRHLGQYHTVPASLGCGPQRVKKGSCETDHQIESIDMFASQSHETRAIKWASLYKRLFPGEEAPLPYADKYMNEFQMQVFVERLGKDMRSKLGLRSAHVFEQLPRLIEESKRPQPKTKKDAGSKPAHNPELAYKGKDSTISFKDFNTHQEKANGLDPRDMELPMNYDDHHRRNIYSQALNTSPTGSKSFSHETRVHESTLEARSSQFSGNVSPGSNKVRLDLPSHTCRNMFNQPLSSAFQGSEEDDGPPIHQSSRHATKSVHGQAQGSLARTHQRTISTSPPASSPEDAVRTGAVSAPSYKLGKRRVIA